MAIPITYNLRNLVVRRTTTIMTALGIGLTVAVVLNVNTIAIAHHLFRDDVTWLRGNHLMQFGGMYQRNFNWHSRNDNGQGIMAALGFWIAGIKPAFIFGLLYHAQSDPVFDTASRIDPLYFGVYRRVLVRI